jgi:hypothetical protein
MSLGLGRVEILNDSLVVLLDDILRNTFHTEDFDIQTLPVGKRIFDLLKGLLVHLVHMHRQATRSIQPLSAPVAFKMLRLLMGDE